MGNQPGQQQQPMPGMTSGSSRAQMVMQPSTMAQSIDYKKCLKIIAVGDSGTQNMYLGVHLDVDPLEREVYVNCPFCKHEVFDAGLENDLEQVLALTCSGARTATNLLVQKKISKQIALTFSSGVTPQKGINLTPITDATLNPSPLKGTPSSGEGIVADQDDEDDEEKSTFDDEFFGLSSSKEKQKSKNPYLEEEKKITKFDKLRKSLGGPIFKPEAQLSQTPSPNKGSKSRGHSPDRQQTTSRETSSKYCNELEDVILFCYKDTVLEDFKNNSPSGVDLNLICRALLKPYFQMRIRILEQGCEFKIGDIMFFVAGCEPHEYGKVTSNSLIRCTQAVQGHQTLNRLNLSPLRRLDQSRTTLMENTVKPYFEDNIGLELHKGMVIEIDDYEFYIKYARPFFGKIQSGTEIKIDSSTPKQVQSIRIAPIWDTEAKLNEAAMNLQIVQEYLKDRYLYPYFYQGFMCYVEKGETILINNMEFFVNDCKPKSGIIDANTQLDIEVGFTKEVFQKKQVLADQRFAEKLFNRESAHGQRGINRTHSQQQPASSSHERARSLAPEQPQLHHGSSAQQADDILNDLLGEANEEQKNEEPNPNQPTLGGASQIRKRAGSVHDMAPDQIEAYDRQLIMQMMLQQQQYEMMVNRTSGSTRQRTVPKAIVQALPEHKITKKFLDSQTEQEKFKCMICMEDYIGEEKIRTMPCLHYFHLKCIDKWLLSRGSTCPVCKFDVRNNYNMQVQEEGW